jgi:catechol 2,3-dioxygenase
MQASYTPALSHFGIFCHDLEKMVRFYCDVFDMQQTDMGEGFTMPFTIVFLSGNPMQHHQLALASGRGEGAPSTVMQVSFKVGSLDALREAKRRAESEHVAKLRGLNHGNALSIYFDDPEGNTVEVYLDTPWYVTQPHGDPLDLERPDAEIWAETERICRADPTFLPIEQWRAQFTDRTAR